MTRVIDGGPIPTLWRERAETFAGQHHPSTGLRRAALWLAAEYAASVWESGPARDLHAGLAALALARTAPGERAIAYVWLCCGAAGNGEDPPAGFPAECPACDAGEPLTGRGLLRVMALPHTWEPAVCQAHRIAGVPPAREPDADEPEVRRNPVTGAPF